MAWFNRVRNWQNDAGNGIGIRADFHDSEDNNFAAGINLSLNIAGGNSPTANIPMAGFRFTGAGDGVAATDFASLGQAQSAISSYAVDASGSGAYAVALSPVVAAYTPGLRVRFKAGTSNTGAATLNVNGLGAITIKRDKGVDLSDNNIISGQVVTVVYDGTNFQLQSPSYATLSQNGAAIYAADSGAANAYVITLSPVPPAYVTGMVINFKATNANTGTSTVNVNGLGIKTIKRDSGVNLLRGDVLASQGVQAIYDGTNFQLTSPIAGSVTQNGSAIFAADAGAINAYAITLSPAISAYTIGMIINFKANTQNTGVTTLNVNGLGAITIKKSVSTDLGAGDILANQLVSVIYDGTNFQMNSLLATGGGITNVATAGLATGGPITGTGTVTVTAAIKSDQTTGTSTVVAVVPAIQHNHISAAKSWVKMTLTAGTPSITVGYNTSSITDSGVGTFIINFTTAFTSGNYAMTSMGITSGVYNFTTVVQNFVTAVPTTSACRILTRGNGTTVDDVENSYVCFFGTL